MDAVGRMTGHTYARTPDQFDIKTLTKEEWERRMADIKTAAEQTSAIDHVWAARIARRHHDDASTGDHTPSS